MIIVKLGGGLGNQLFQYACGRSLSVKNSDILKLDIEAYTANNPRVYGLGRFNIVENIARQEEIRKLRLPYGFLSRCVRSFKARILRQFNIGFNPKILELKGDIYLEGYWKNEKYFIDIEETIRKEFTLRNPLSQAAQEIKGAIFDEACPVSLHVRRGDYVEVTGTLKYHGVCTPEYYRDALAYTSMRVPISRLFIFSDDIEWVKNNMTFDFPVTFVSQADIPDYEELMLMSYCKHNIIANSTFSWWGAWLNMNEDKIIVVPKRWLAKTGTDYYEEIPLTWIKL
jgi:hypothetical protein